MKELKDMTATELQALTADIGGELARRAGEGYVCANGRDGQFREIPTGGVVCETSWATEAHTCMTWFANIGSARASLLQLAQEMGRMVVEDTIDLTMPGCVESWSRLIVL